MSKIFWLLTVLFRQRQVAAIADPLVARPFLGRIFLGRSFKFVRWGTGWGFWLTMIGLLGLISIILFAVRVIVEICYFLMLRAK